MVRAQLTGRPLSILRHSHTRLQRAVSDELARRSFDVVHAEQVQALHNIPASAALPPLVFRAQNVESHLWRMVGAARPMLGYVARHEAMKMAAVEAEALRRADMTMVLTRDDGEALAGGLGMAARRIRIVRPPFPASLPTSDEPMKGDPAIVLLGGGWLPNRDSIRWFFESIWSRVRDENPGAHAHVFGAERRIRQPSTSSLPSPDDSQKIFHEDAILVVPLRIASGIRMKIIESWARGVPVVATPEAVKGLDVVNEEEVLLAESGSEFASAIRRLREEPGRRESLVEAGRKRLVHEFDPAAISRNLEETYKNVISSPAGRGSDGSISPS
jgi:hypothetical protein